MRLKCTTAKHGTSSRISHQVCTQEVNPGALNPVQSQVWWTPCHAFTGAAWSGFQISIRHFWQASAPGCTFVTALVGSALAQLCELCGSAHLADTGCGSTKICGEAAAISAATFATESRAAPLHTGGPQNCRQSHFLYKSALKTAKEKQTPFKPCFAELGLGPGCILFLTTVWETSNLIFTPAGSVFASTVKHTCRTFLCTSIMFPKMW